MAALLVLAGLVLGGIIGWLVGHSRQTAVRARLEAELDLCQKGGATSEDRFARLSQEALERNRAAFLDLASDKLREFRLTASAELAQREQAVSHLLQPIRDALAKTEAHLSEVERARIAQTASLSQEIRMLAESHRVLGTETRALVQALRRPQVRGRWGELTLRRLVELAGMVDHCDFEEQHSVRSADGVLQRPDLLIKLPEDRLIVVDAKTPLDAYLTAMEAPSDEARDAALKQHAHTVREHVRRLAHKNYWSQFARTPEFVVLFIPGDQFLSAALEADPALLEQALLEQVILATPTSLIALLRAVAFGWRQRALEENAEQIQRVGTELYGRLSTFTAHLGVLGDRLGSGVDAYNKAVGSLERMVLPQARRLAELGIGEKKPLSQPEALDLPVRTPRTAAPGDGDPGGSGSA